MPQEVYFMKAASRKQQRPSSRLSGFLLATALLCAGSALAAPSQVSVSILSDGTNTITVHSYDPATGDYAGQDNNTNNNIVRTNDAISYGLQLSLQPGNTNNTIVSVLPKVNGQIYETWQGIPTGCDTKISTISADRLTLTCIIPGPTTQNQSLLITATAKVTGNVPNGTVLPAPTTTISSDEYGTSAATIINPNLNTAVTVTAKPRYDLGKTLPTYTPDSSGVIGNHNNTYTLKNVPGPDGVTPGTLIGFPILLAASYGTDVGAENLSKLTAADELKGLSPLTQPITFQDDLSKIPGAVIYNENGNWVNPLANTAGGCVTFGIYRVGGVNPNVNGTCTVTSNNSNGIASTGTVANISITNLVLNANNDNNVSRFLTDTGSSGSVIDAHLNEFERVLLVWVPNYYPYKSTAENGKATTGSYQNSYTGFNPVSSVDGQVNIQPATNLYTGGTDTTGTVNDSNYVNLVTPTPSIAGNAGKSFSTDIIGNRGIGNARGAVATGTAITSSIRFQNNSTGVSDWNNIVICDKIDNTTFNVNPIGGVEVTGVPGTLTTSTANIATPYTTGGIKYYIVEYSSTGADGAAGGWGTRDSNNHSAAQATATCGDEQGPWYTDIASAGGASAVTKVRVRTNYPLYSPANSYYGDNTIDATFNLIVVGTTSEPKLMDNWGTVTSSSFGPGKNNPFGPGAGLDYIADKNGLIWASYGAVNNVTTPYVSRMGDEAWLVAAKASIKKTIPRAVSNGTVIAPADAQKINGNSVATFQLSPALTLANATSNTAYPVTVIDTLPKYFTYIPGSASQNPDSVVKNSDGTTTISWTLNNIVPSNTGTISPVTFQATVDANTPDGTRLTNTAYISTPADPPSTVAANRALAGSTYLSSTYVDVNNTTGIYPIKTVLTPYVAPQGIAQYQLAWYSLGSGSASSPQIIDVLPYVGDGRGTTNTPLGLASALASATNDTTMVFYYTSTAPGRIKQDPNDVSNALTVGADVSSGSTVWCKVTSFGQPGCPADLSAVTGIRGVSTQVMTAGTQYSTVISVKTSQSPKDGDLYTNSMSVRATGLEFLATSSNVTAQVQLFSISGTVFNDSTNQDGTQNTGEKGLSGVTLTLGGYSFGPDGQDNGGTGNDIAVPQNTTVTTDADGHYTFANLGPGRYTITETQPSGYTTTKNTVGSAGGNLSGDIISNIVLNPEANFSAATGYNFGENLSYVQPLLHKWVDNCGSNDNLSGCPAVHAMTDGDSTNSTALPGDILRYTLILNNNNGVGLPATFIHDQVPDHTTFIGATADVVPTSSGIPLISTDTVNLDPAALVLPSTWTACTGVSNSAVTCNATGVSSMNIGWNTDSDTTSLQKTDLLPANTQLRVTFWVKVN